MVNKRVIIDTNFSQENLIVLSEALKSTELCIEAISIIFGGSKSEITSHMIDAIRHFSKKPPIIIAGSQRPLFYKKKEIPKVVPENRIKTDNNISTKYDVEINEFSKLYYLLKNSKDKIKIICLGPLTNIARLLLIDPEIKKNIAEIHFYAGFKKIDEMFLGDGFNLYADSYAAKIVFESGIPIVISDEESVGKSFFNYINKKTGNKPEFITKKQNDRCIRSSEISSLYTLLYPELFELELHAASVVTSKGDFDGMIVFDKVNNSSEIYLATTKSENEDKKT